MKTFLWFIFSAILLLPVSWAHGDSDACNKDFWKIAIVKDMAKIQDPDLICFKERLIHLAVSHYSDVKVLKAFLAKKPDINAISTNKETPLVWAARHGRVEAVEILMGMGAKDAEYLYGSKALQRAVDYGHSDIVEILLKHGARVNDPYDILNDPVIRGDGEMVKTLVENGINVKNYDESMRILTLAIMYEIGLEAFRALVENGAEIDSQLLHLAAKSIWKQAEIVKYLVEKGVNVNGRDKHGNTPLHYAAKVNLNGNGYASTKILVDNGADVNIPNKVGRTPLHNVTEISLHSKKRNRIAIFLLENGAHPNVVDNKGDTPLYLAGIFLSEELLRSFLKHGVDVNAINSEGRTILMKVAYLNTRAVEILLENGANVHIKDDNGKTAWDVADNSIYVNEEIKELLREAGARGNRYNIELWEEHSD